MPANRHLRRHQQSGGLPAGAADLLYRRFNTALLLQVVEMQPGRPLQELQGETEKGFRRLRQGHDNPIKVHPQFRHNGPDIPFIELDIADLFVVAEIFQGICVGHGVFLYTNNPA